LQLFAANSERYNAHAQMRYMFTEVIVESSEGGYIAYVEELPGAHTQGETVEEASRRLDEAVDIILTGNRRFTRAPFASARVVRVRRRAFGREEAR